VGSAGADRPGARSRPRGSRAPRRACGWAAVLAATLALTGCVGGPDERRTTPTPSASTTSVPSKPDFDDLVVSPAGLGSLRVGAPATSSGMIKYFPDYCPTATAEGRSTEGRWQNTYVPRGKPRPFGVDVGKDGRITRIDIIDPSLRTAEGIGLGTTVEELLSTYPAVEGGSSSTLGDLYYLRTSEGTLVFEVANDLIEDYYEDDVVGTVIFLRVVAPTVNPDQPLAGTDFYAGRCL
jgi:hypothetical protein